MSEKYIDYGTMKYGEEYQISSQAQLSDVIPSLKREHYELSCWKDQDGNTYDQGEKITPTKHLQLSAQWRGELLDVNYHIGYETQLLVTSTSGKTYNFKYDELPARGILQYTDNNGFEPTEKIIYSPFNKNSELSIFDSVCSIDDTKGEISCIGYGCFQFCHNLHKISCPNAKVIEYMAFNCADGLMDINCPEVTSIGEYWVFEQVPIETLNLPKLKSVGCQGFGYSLFKNLILSSVTQVPSLGTDAFCERTEGLSCYVPNSLISEFESTWGTEYPELLTFIGV